MNSKNVLALGVLAAFMLIALVPSASDADTALKVEHAYYQEVDDKYYVTVEFNVNPNEYGVTGFVIDKNDNDKMLAKQYVAGVEDTKMSFKLSASTDSSGIIVTFTDGTFSTSSAVGCKIKLFDGSTELDPYYCEKIGDTIPSTYKPTLSGKTFSYWCSDSGLTTKWDHSKAVMKSMSLYAKSIEDVYYTITVKVNGSGTAYPTPASATEGETIRLTAIPGTDYSFKEWVTTSKGVEIRSNTFSMPANNVVITAVFEKEYDIDLIVEGHGKATASKYTAFANDTITLKQSPNDGYSFKGWVSSDVTISDNNQFTMPSKDVTIKAVFDKEYTVTLKIEGNGLASASKTTAFANDEISLNQSADALSYFKEWKTDVTGVTVDKNNKFKMPEKNITVTAVFEDYKDIIKECQNGNITIPRATSAEWDIRDQTMLSLSITQVTESLPENIPSSAKAFKIQLSYDKKTMDTFINEVTVVLKSTDILNAKVYHVSEDGKTTEDVSASYAAGSYKFSENDLTAYFVISAKEIEPVTEKTDNTAIIIAIAGFIAIIVVVLVILIYKNRTI